MATFIATSTAQCRLSRVSEAESKGRYFAKHIRNRFRDELVYRNEGGGRACEGLEQQLRSSVLLAEARAAQKRDAVQAAGVHE